jgi:hypothetical protein
MKGIINVHETQPRKKKVKNLQFHTYKVKLNPTSEQFMKMCSWGGYSRDFYDLALNYIIQGYLEARERLESNPIYDLRLMSANDLIEDYREEEATRSIYDICPHAICNGAVQKAYLDVESFNNRKILFMPKPSYKRKGKGKNKLSFFMYPRDIKISDEKIRINKLGVVKFAEKGRIPMNIKIRTLLFVYDGNDWYITINTLVNSKMVTKNKCDKPQVKLFDEAHINLINEHDRLYDFYEVFKRKTNYSKKWYKAMNRLRGHAGYVGNIVLDMERKYNCDNVKDDIDFARKEVRQVLHEIIPYSPTELTPD